MREIIRPSQQFGKKMPCPGHLKVMKCLILLMLVMDFDGACRKSSEESFSSHAAPTPSSSFGAGFLLSNAPVQVGHAIKLSDLLEGEIRFGIAPKRGPGVTYQDNIILMEQGDRAIQSFASDGMSWTFDANAAQVNDIQVGKVLFATDRCGGKVLAVQHNGGSVSVVLGPVQLNEVVKEGNFAYDQPLDLNNAIAVVAPDYAGAVGSKALQEEIKKPAQTSQNVKQHSYHRAVSYYVVSDHGTWTPMRTVVSGSVPFAQAPLYAALPENHPAVKNETLGLRDLTNDDWILFPKRLHPIVYDAIMAAARRDGIRPKCTHDAVTAEQAIHLVSEQVGVGIVTKPNAFDSRPKNVVLKPFSDKSLRFETCVIMRKGDDSRLTNQFVRTLLRKFKPSPQAGGQMELSLSA